MTRRTKYKSTPTIVDNIGFASKKEAIRYMILKDMEREGEISSLELQPVFILQSKFKRGGKTIKAIKYIADFLYFVGDKAVVEDVKGFRTQVYMIKKKLFLKKYPEYEFKEVM